nr:MAG TPA: hypothetical protein [Caudoviricetes sp.]
MNFRFTNRVFRYTVFIYSCLRGRILCRTYFLKPLPFNGSLWLQN